MLEDDILLNESDILERIDEYTLYCHYLGYQPDIGMAYSSPLREDLTPSFGIYPSKFVPNREYLWKDQALGVHGDVFKLIKLIMEKQYGTVSRYMVLAQVKSDFGIIPSLATNPRLVTETYVPKVRSLIEIRIKSKPFEPYDLKYWNQFNVSLPILDKYRVKSIRYYWTAKDQAVPKFPSGLAYAYIVNSKHKLYFPYERKEYKFRNDLTEKELEGFEQLQYNSDTLIITKATKDIMCLRSFEYEAVSPRGETTLIDPHYIDYLRGKYKNIYVLFDNDGKHKASEYPFPARYVPKDTGEKDISDFCKTYGPADTQHLLKQLIC